MRPKQNRFKNYNYRVDGITQSLLQSFQTCRKRTEYYLNGWTPKSMSSSLTYGTIIHGVLELVYSRVQQKQMTKTPTQKRIKFLVAKVKSQWLKENPKADSKALESLECSLCLAESILPVYFKHFWKEDSQKIHWIKLESKFAIPFTTSDGRKTIIRGKKDGVYGKKTLRLFETKTKSRVNQEMLIKSLWFEFQVRLYLWALWKIYGKVPSGVNYNIIRKTSLAKRKTETYPQFARRAVIDIKLRPNFYFMRLNIPTSEEILIAFEKELDSLIINFMDWCECKSETYLNTQNCDSKYGYCSYLDLCSDGDFFKFTKRDSVFSELQDY